MERNGQKQQNGLFTTNRNKHQKAKKKKKDRKGQKQTKTDNMDKGEDGSMQLHNIVPLTLRLIN